MGTHLVLHLHRRVEREIRQGGGGGSNNNIVTIKNECWEGKQTLISMSSAKAAVVIPVLVLTIVIQILGATTTTFKFTYSGITNFTTEHSLISIGANIPETSRDEDGALIHLLQAFYFILALAVPVYSCVMYAVLFFTKSTPNNVRRIFTLSEIALSWSAMDVYLVASVCSVVQTPNFGKKILEEYCTDCIKIEAEIYPAFSLTCIGAVLNFVVGLWLVKTARGVLHHSQ